MKAATGASQFALEIADIVADRLRDRTVQQRLYCTQEAAKYLGLSPSQVQKFASSGRLRAVRVDSSLRFDVRDLDQLIENGKG